MWLVHTQTPNRKYNILRPQTSTPSFFKEQGYHVGLLQSLRSLIRQ